MNKQSSEQMKKSFQSLIMAFKELFSIIPNIFTSFFKAINKRLKFSITFKTTTIHTFSLITSLILNSIVIIVGVLALLVYQDYTSLNRNYNSIREKIINNDAISIEDPLLEFSTDNQIEISIFNSQKELYYTTDDFEAFTRLKENFEKINISSANNIPFFHLINQAEINDNIYYIQLSKPIDSYINIVLISVAVVGGLNLILVISSAIKLSRTTKKMLRPIDNMTNTAKSISANDLDRRLDVVESHDELKELAETFNEMLDRIQKSYDQQNQFVSDASHELRTPIAVIQGYANMLNRWGKEDKEVLEESITAINSEALNMKELVEKLLFLARADKKTQKLQKSEFYFNELIDEITKETKMIDDKHQIICERNDSVLIFADRGLIKQALRIFIDNSIKYTSAGGTIKINSIGSLSGLTITIEDSGVGIAKEDLPKIFHRFYRCDKARTRQTGGTGLGLTIAKWIIDNHNGSIEVESTLGQGTKIIIHLS
jgi:signal transduction histidine kinase